MTVSYADELAVDHSVFRRNLIQSEWYQDRWGDQFRLAKDQNLKTLYENSKRTHDGDVNLWFGDGQGWRCADCGRSAESQEGFFRR